LDVLGTVNNAPGGVVSVQAGRTIRFFNNVAASGSFTGPGTVEFLAGFSPGPALTTDGTGAASFDGAVTLGPASVAHFDLASAGSFDQLDAAGGLSAGGTLEVTLLGGFSPAPGQTFDLFDGPPIAGRFDRVVLPALATGLAWDASGLYASGRLAVVPEPAAAITLLCGAFTSLLRRSRRRPR
jgi:hypothetical protein